jgi:DNA-binding protein YbaB
MSMPDAGYESTPQPEVSLDDLIAGLERVRASTYQSRDRNRLVTAVVDGDGLVVRIAFGDTVAGWDRRMVEMAVREAVRGARHRLAEAFGRLATAGGAAPVDAEPAGTSVGEPPALAAQTHGAPLPGGVLSDTTVLEEQ